MSEEREFKNATLSILEEIGAHMPGGFFIYHKEEPEEVIYVNKTVLDIYGCADEEEFRKLTGNTFKGMVYPDDYDRITASINKQILESEDNMDHVEYRITRKDGQIRWVDDYGHYTTSKEHGGIYYVFISDVTEKYEKLHSSLEERNAVISALNETYNSVWLISDISNENISVFSSDGSDEAIRETLKDTHPDELKFSDIRDYFIENSVADEDKDRLKEELSYENILKRLEDTSEFSTVFLKKEDDETKYFNIFVLKMEMPSGKTGVVLEFKDIDSEVREEQKVRQVIDEAKKTEEENLKLMAQVESAAKLAELMGSVASLLSNMPAMSFSKDAQTGKYLACNDAFAAYAHKDSPEGVVGLTDFEIFDEETAQHFFDDDQKALNMDEPYIFFEDVPDAAGNPRSFQTTKLKFYDETGRLCTLGMCVDVTEISRSKAAEAEVRVKQQELEHRLALQEELLRKEEERT